MLIKKTVYRGSVIAAVLTFFLVVGPQIADAAPLEYVVNREGITYDSHPSISVCEDGTTWIAWHAYFKRQDQVLLRRIDADGSLGQIHIVSGEEEVNGLPTVVPITSKSVWVIWTAKTGPRWQVLARRHRGEQWEPPIRVSQTDQDAIQPAAVVLPGGGLAVAWSGHQSGRFRTWCRLFDDGEWQRPFPASSLAQDAFRPTFAAESQGGVWVFWDQYNSGNYEVCGRNVFFDLGPIERLSSRGANCLTPTALATRKGLCVAWLQKADVIGGPGVISQRHTLQMAIRKDDRWQIVLDSQGGDAAAELTHGLMAKIDPQTVATGGYLGRRTHPMLLEDGDGVWLLWEHKADHRASTPNAVGDLLGRPMRDGRWQETALLHRGKVDYHLAHPPHAAGNTFTFFASDLPRHNRRIYHRLVGDLTNTVPFTQDAWTGWRPVQLPIATELTERQEIQIEDETYKLYWADLHCHSGLTADAEGEPDELTHYARDRAMLDVVVFTENDFIYDVPMTQYEYELGNFVARVYSREHHFLSLPGYEWTSRIPAAPDAKLSDPGNWTVPYQNRSHANHRSVIYPPTAGPAIRYFEVANDISTLNRAVADAGGITLTQHEVFRVSGHDVEVGMEVASGWRNYILRRRDSFHGPLNQGARLAFVANGDSHRRAPGLSGALTGIFAEDLKPEVILAALRQRRCYATYGSRIFLDSRANGVFMGQETNADRGNVALKLLAIGTRPILSAHLIRDGVELKVFKGVQTRRFSVEYQDSDLSKGAHWYYWRVSQERDAPDLPGNLMVAHGHLAWTSPHWVNVK